jgi:hypothetical protein
MRWMIDGDGRLLLRALLARDEAVAAKAGREWLETVDLQLAGWDQTRMLPMLFRRLTDAGVRRLPPLLRGAYRKAWVQNHLGFHAVTQTLTGLDSLGIPSVVLKGAALIPAYAGDMGVRDMSDVDVLVPVAELPRAASLLAAHGWRPLHGLTHAGVVARFADRRHSWNYERGAGLELDLHWHVLQSSRGPRADQSFFDASVPLLVGPKRARRLCDADLLLHVLEHSRHGEPDSRLRWVVDAALVLRAAPDPGPLAARLAAQAAAHDLTADVRPLLGVVAELGEEPVAELCCAALGRVRSEPSRGLRRRLGDHARGGEPLVGALRGAARESIDGRLARRPRAWRMYVASGRRPRVERALVAVAGPLTRSPTTPDSARVGDDGWLELSEPAVVEAVCGPGWSFPQPEAGGTWTEGREARISLMRPSGGRLVLELDLVVLGSRRGAPRRLDVRVDGRWAATAHGGYEDELRPIVIEVAPADVLQPLAVSLLVTHSARPRDLGINSDTRRLGVFVRRIRVCGAG